MCSELVFGTHPLAELLRVVAGAGAQVGGVDVVRIRELRFVEPAIGVGVVVGDLGGIDEAIGVLADLCGSRARAAPPRPLGGSHPDVDRAIDNRDGDALPV